MICPKCKSEISDTALRCPHCNLKVKIHCPECKALIRFGLRICNRCGAEVLKICENCGSVNLAQAKVCRKCHQPLEREEKVFKNLKTIAQEQQELLEIQKQEENINKQDETVSKEEIIQEEPKTETQETEQTEIIQNEENIEDKEIITETSEDTEKETIQEKIQEEIQPEIINDENLSEEEITEEENAEEIENEETKEFDSEEETKEEYNYEPDNALTQETEEETEPEEDEAQGYIKESKLYNNKTFEQTIAKEKIKLAIKREQTHIISLCGDEGLGKTTILKNLITELNKEKYDILYIECNANTQISPYGALQTILKKYFGLKDFYFTKENYNKILKTKIGMDINFLSAKEQRAFYNFLYPVNLAYYEDCYLNKEEIYKILTKIMTHISEQYNSVIVIDGFEMIDIASYKFMLYMLKEGLISSKLKLLFSYKDCVDVQNYLQFIDAEKEVYENIYLKKTTPSQVNDFVKIFIQNENLLPDNIKNQLKEKYNANPACIEQAIFYLNEMGAFKMSDENKIVFNEQYNEFELPKTIKDIVEARLNIIKKSYPVLSNAILQIALFGTNFNSRVVQAAIGLDIKNLENMITFLLNSGYIVKTTDNDYAFKNTLLWKTVYDIAKSDENFITNNEKVLTSIISIPTFNNSIKALISQNANEHLLAFNLWTRNIKIASAVGDVDLYILSQKQCLRLLDNLDYENTKYVENNIHERIGKLTYKTKPYEATNFLTNALVTYKNQGNIIKTIELAGFLMKSQKLSYNNYPVIEIVDNILSIVPKEYVLERALIKSKKVDELLHIGNYEEVTNLINNEIIPVLEEHLAKTTEHKKYSHVMLLETWLKCSIIAVQAYALQGNDKALDVLNVIDEVVVANNIENEKFANQIEVAKALAYTLKGQVEISEQILNALDLQEDYPEQRLISNINFIKVLNKVIKSDMKDIRNLLFDCAAFANNCNDFSSKNIFKVILAKIMQEEGNLKKSLDIYNEEITYFAKEKIAIGALLCWYCIAEASIISEGEDRALEIAMKALDVAKNPKISNYHFMILYKKLIAEIYLIKGDYEAVKMYIEKALLIARKQGLDYHQMILYDLYGKYYEEILINKIESEKNPAAKALSMYEKAEDFAKQLELFQFIKKAEDGQKSVKVFCQLNGSK